MNADAGFDTILLIHGLWLSPLSWEPWIERFEAEGYKVLAPAWPGVPERFSNLGSFRDDPSALHGVGPTEIVAHYQTFLDALSPQPLIIGHSFGGLITQILLDRGYGVAGVALGSAPVKGNLLLPFSSLRIPWYSVDKAFFDMKPVALTPEQFHYAFGNHFTAEESADIYERLAVPGPDHVLLSAAFAALNPESAACVCTDRADRAPLLLGAGEKDQISPPSLSRMNLDLYRRGSSAKTDYREFANRTHFMIGERGWEEVADFALDWAALNHKSA